MDNTKSNKVIFFDCYQTLIDIQIDKEQKQANEQKAWEKLAFLLKERGIPTDTSTFVDLLEKRKANFYATRDKKFYHHNFYALVEAVIKNDLKADISADDLAALIYEYRKIARGYARLYPKVADALAKLAQEYTLAIASYTQASFTQSELRELNIEQYFSYFIYSSEIGIHKEPPGFYEECLRVVGEDAKDCVMIGDHYREDILSSRKIGLNAIWVRNPATLSKFADIGVVEAGYTIALEDFDTLPDLIARIFTE